MNSWEVSTVEALRLGAEALRADAQSVEVLGPLADPESAARDSAAARALDALANAGADPASILAVAEGLRLVADAWMHDDARFGELCRIEATFRRLTGCDPSPIAEPSADEDREDRIVQLGGASDPADLAACVAEAVSGERLRTASAACGILAARIADLTPRERLELADAIRDDWTIPDR